ncbi:hypothetical protein P5673_008164 [Acropora cervicornis]|uniref:Uncharacterized protein n=2 Tax=Acropora TaxID=6127 RepID=A0AAD9QUK8_ACRCE|nr:hypothetical protein P5673_008164 [Acropora cervicornis]
MYLKDMRKHKQLHWSSVIEENFYTAKTSRACSRKRQRISFERPRGDTQSHKNFPMKQTETQQSDSDLNTTMAAPKYHYPRLPRKKTFEQQATVDEIMEVVADQGRRQSLSRADYSAQKRIETGLRRQQRATSDSSSFDDSSSCTSLSDISTSPPPTRQSSVSSISDEGGNTKMFEFRSRPRTLPPLNRHRTHRPCRPTPPKFDYEEETEILDSASRLSRPMSAIGQRSRPQRGFTL